MSSEDVKTVKLYNIIEKYIINPDSTKRKLTAFEDALSNDYLNNYKTKDSFRAFPEALSIWPDIQHEKEATSIARFRVKRKKLIDSIIVLVNINCLSCGKKQNFTLPLHSLYTFFCEAGCLYYINEFKNNVNSVLAQDKNWAEAYLTFCRNGDTHYVMDETYLFCDNYGFKKKCKSIDFVCKPCLKKIKNNYNILFAEREKELKTL